MKTRLTTRPDQAAHVLISGGIAAFPTETVYGLGANVFDEEAVRDIFRAKGRPGDNPLIVHVENTAQIDEVARRVPPHARKLMRRFFPGPLTIVLPRHPTVPGVVSAGLDTVGIRMPRHPVARAFLRACGFPVAAPSANRSGRPSPTSWQAVRDDLDGRIPIILKGGRAPVGLESTVVDCSGRVPVVLRAGAVTLEQLRRAVPATRMAGPRDRAKGRSPGLRHRHYAPRARVRIVDGGPWTVDRGRDTEHGSRVTEAFIGLHRPAPGRFALLKRCRDVRAYARELFHFFRGCDQAGVRIIYCEAVPERGLGAAVMDRIRRAARR
jgi:L-threonylcarbamoyladenylate synthase